MRKYILIIPALLCAILFAGCDNAEYEIRDNAVYIAAAASASNSTVVALPAEGADIGIVVRLAKQVDRDVTVSLKHAPELLEEYNKVNDTEYTPIPDFTALDDVQVTIKAGEISKAFSLHIDNFPGDETYAIPVAIGEVLEGGVVKSISQSVFIYLLSKPLEVSVPVLSAGSAKCNPETGWGLALSNWSLEFWARMDGYARANQAIFGNDEVGKNEIYIRFGDANSPYSYIQIKTCGHGGVNSNNDLKPNVWYHWAFVYDGKNIIIYRNGQLEKQSEVPTPDNGVVKVDKWFIVRGSWSNKVSFSHVRFWQTALSQEKIQNNMHFALKPTNPDLIAYWPMNEGEGYTFHDITGNEHHGTLNPTTSLVRWDHNVRFD